jgi:hypothetical protein
MKIKKEIFFTISSLFIIIFINLFIFFNIQSNREISNEPDDYYHILSKASNQIYCVTSKCFEKNLYKYSKSDLKKKEKYLSDRQSHRLILEYHPLYSFLLSNFIHLTKINIFKGELIFRIIVYILASLLAVIIFKKYFKNFNIILVSLIFATHFNFLPGQHLIYPSGIASLIAFVSYFLIFRYKYI